MRAPTLAILALLCGCSRPADPPPPTPPPAPGAQAPSAPAPAPIHRFHAELMGTPWAIQIAGGDGLQAKAAVDAAFTEVARLEAALSEWRDDSDLGRLNAAPADAWVTVSPDAYMVIEQGLALGHASGGAFDVTWAALRGLWDFKAQPPRLPLKRDLDAAVARVDYRGLLLDAHQPQVKKTRDGMAVGLGGIAKGYAIDKAAAVLKAHGLRAFIVDGGGDLFIAGEKAPGVPWTVGVQHPRADRVLLALPARDQAVVSSGDYERFFELGGRRYHHILDPKTGLPAGKSVAVTVRAPDATRADALATALFVLGPVEGLALAQAQGVDAAILGPDGAIAVTAGLAELFPKRWKD
ncbi:MAG: FAD:protein FMN transferase [Myxococcales bacterium]|nr:FAD:protein FMN transferase [Myxococcales bacterium]